MIGNKKIAPTAWIIAYRRTFSDIPFVQEIFDSVEKIRMKSGAPEVLDELKKPERSPLFEARYKLVSRLLLESNTSQVLEIASGLSPRGLVMSSDKDVHYVEIDLPEVAATKKEIVDALAPARANLFLEEGDALRGNDLLKVCAHFERTKPLAIINEGLLAYLTFEEKTVLAENIHGLLSIFGGVWITPDIIWPESKEGNSYTQHMQKLTGAAIDRNRFKNEAEARAFFEAAGFEVESRPFSEIFTQLVSPKKLGQTPEETKEIIGSSVAFVMRVKTSQK